MTNSYTQVPPDSTGDKIDTEQLTVSAQTVERQRIQIAGSVDTQIAPVDGTAGLKVDLGADNGVTVGGSLPSGTNNIGDVDILTIATGDNNIGNVDVETIVPATGATNLGKAVDAVAGASDTGVAVLAVRDDVLGGLSETAGKYVQMRVDADGAMWVIPSGTTTVDGTVTANAGTGTMNVDLDSLAATAIDVNNGSVSAGTMRVTIADDSTGLIKLAAGSAKIGSALASGTHLYDGLAGAPGEAVVKFASVDVAAASDNQIVALVSSKSIRVLSYVLVASGGANTLTWKSATAGNISGGMGVADTGGISANSQTGLFQTTAGEALELTLSAATSVDGHISYIEVD